MIKIKMYNEQFYTAHPSIYTFIDVIKQIQYTTIIKIVVLIQSYIFMFSKYKNIRNQNIIKTI